MAPNYNYHPINNVKRHNPPFCKDSQIECSAFMGLLIFILNWIPGAWGTFISMCVDRKGCNFTAFLVWILQNILSVFILGYIWAIFHGYAIWAQNSR